MNKEQFKFLEPAIGKEESRKVLMFAHFKAENRKIVVTAANAYLIKRVSIETDLPDGEYFLNHDAVKQIIKLAKVSSEIQLTVDGVLVEGATVPWTKCNFEYPDLGKLCAGPFGEQSESKIGIRCANMALVLKNAPGMDCKIDFGIESNDEKYCCEVPMRFTWTNAPDCMAILMPVRIRW